jgi:transcription elongation GreA/GreB family factor
MSRAFVRENDQAAASESVPERVVSAHPNLVTPRGLRQIETRVRDLERARQEALAADDTATLATVARDIRYWAQRRATARLVEPQPAPEVVRFGVQVTVRFDDGAERVFRLVGEDEADPPRELLSWVSPLAESLMGREVGDRVEVLGREAEIVSLSPDQDARS